MNFSAGNWVILRHSGAKGIIAKVLDADMVMVYIQADDMEIPIAMEDIQLYEEYILDQETANQPLPEKESPPAPEHQQKHPQGLYLGFEPIAGMDGTTSWFGISIINNSGYDILFHYIFETKAGKRVKKEAKLNDNAVYETHKMLFDDLNDSPKIRLQFRQVTTAGIEPPVTKEIKIKPKKLLMVKNDIYLIKIDHNFEQTAKQKDIDLTSYTKQNAKPVFKKKKKQFYQYGSMNLKEKVEFKNEIDLHIRKLRPDYKSLKKGQILHIQLDAFDVFIQKAIRLGVDRVFVIHGMGEGKLKDMIAGRLIQNPLVKSFKNEYHHKYGWGATEVIF